MRWSAIGKNKREQEREREKRKKKNDKTNDSKCYIIHVSALIFSSSRCVLKDTHNINKLSFVLSYREFLDALLYVVCVCALVCISFSHSPSLPVSVCVCAREDVYSCFFYQIVMNYWPSLTELTEISTDR